MKLAEKILDKTKVEEKVKDTFFQDAAKFGQELNKLKGKMKNSEFKDVLNIFGEFVDALDGIDEKEAIKQSGLLGKFVKDLKIEE